jgi:hypothetical protein
MASLRRIAGLAIISQVTFGIIAIILWSVNLYKLTQCNFEPSYKAEVLYGIGVISPTCLITAWMNIEDKTNVVIIDKTKLK